MKNINIKNILMKIGSLMALILICIVLSVSTEKFLRIDNLMNVLRQASINSLISAGMLLTLITAGIDLSVGSNCALAICVMGVMLKSGITNPLILMGTCIIIGIITGFLNGILLTRLDLPHPFVSTLGMRNMTRGLALLITMATPIGGFPEEVQFLGAASIGSGKFKFPVSFIAVILIFICFDILLNKTALGRQIYCVGGNPEAARLSGINSKGVLTVVYTISGLMSALGGIILVGRVDSAFPLAGDTFDTDAIASCIIGGASFMGGKGTIWGTLIGSLIITVIRNGLNLIGASSDLQQIIIGAVIILAVFIDVVRGKLDAKARKLAAV